MAIILILHQSQQTVNSIVSFATMVLFVSQLKLLPILVEIQHVQPVSTAILEMSSQASTPNILAHLALIPMVQLASLL